MTIHHPSGERVLLNHPGSRLHGIRGVVVQTVGSLGIQECLVASDSGDMLMTPESWLA